MRKKKIYSKLSILYKPHTRKKTKDRIEQIWFSLFNPQKISKDEPLGHTFEIEPYHRSIFIDGKFHYFSKTGFKKIMKDLKRCVDFYFKQKAGERLE